MMWTRAKGLKQRTIATVLALTLLLTVAPMALAAQMPTELVPVGQTVGINIKCDGVMIVALGEVETDTGTVSPAKAAGLLPGDVITQVGTTRISSLAEFKAAIEKSGTEIMAVQIDRAGETLQTHLLPARDQSGANVLGLWLRDGMAGIGTVTFYDPASGLFGALGHSVSDVETGALVPLGEGAIMPATVKSVRKGEAGMPGELQGEFDFAKKIGSLTANTLTGIFGKLEDNVQFQQEKALPIGGAKDIALGPATILANINGKSIQEFDIEITRIFSGGDDRNMMITVTDPALITQTGGIVQGMSGSPIIQDGKIVGAVTHVLINNPEKGYGISIESMLRSLAQV
ncbi:MAG: SpoIVB peptidase [Oscillospiraceae bacterium]|nr:SpoIVB peptidase [Oscillospiraceae bacterium]